MTFDPAIDWMPVWSPDGTQIVFQSSRTGGIPSLFRKAANGVGVEERLAGTEQAVPSDWSRDGRYLIFGQAGDIWFRRTDGDGAVTRYLQTPATEQNGRLSADGRWLAYESDESGDAQVYVRPFPDAAGGKWQVSAAGGRQAHWRRDGRELYFVAAQRQLVAVSVDTTTTFAAGAPHILFEAPMADGLFNYDVVPDGSRFLINVVDEGEAARTTPLSIVTNWSAVLHK